LAPAVLSTSDPLRVLVVVTRAERGGAQVHVRDLVLGLSDRARIEVVVGEDGFLVDALREGGATVHVLTDLQRSIAVGPDLRALRGLREHIRRFEPQLVHTHSTKAGLLGRLAAASLGVPCVHTAHAWSFSDGLPWTRKAFAVPLEAAVGRVTDHFIAVSDADREVGERWHVVAPGQATVVHNAVADTIHRAQPGRSGTPRIAMVARLASPKEPVVLLEALARIDLPWQLRVVGDGPDRAQVEAAVARLGLSERVELLGMRGDVPELLADSDIFALVSRQEGFPIAILEAMRAGLPVVASHVGGVAEAVQHEDTGLLVPRGDVDALQGALQRLLSSASLRECMGVAGRHAYARRFSLDAMLRATVRVYDRVAAAKASSTVRPAVPQAGAAR